MSVNSRGGELDELERLRRAYETSLSWRVTRPLRALARALRSPESADETSEPAAEDLLGPLLEQFYGERLATIDARCAQGSSDELYALFRELDDDVWALLLTQEYKLYPHIRALLPSMPEAALQEIWNGASGLALASQSRAFYSKLKASYERHGGSSLSTANVLDFGCGWGRLTRYLARDVAPGHLYGCDPVEGILEICRSNRVPATFAQSAFLPDRLPFDAQFDLAFAFSVFTHLSEAAHERSLLALHRSMRPGAILIVTIRPPAYLSHSEAMRPLVDLLEPGADSALATPRYLFVPHPIDATHPQAERGEQIEYGETVITMAYVRRRWSPLFELLETNVQLEDLHQVMLTLRRR